MNNDILGRKRSRYNPDLGNKVNEEFEREKARKEKEEAEKPKEGVEEKVETPFFSRKPGPRPPRMNPRGIAPQPMSKFDDDDDDDEDGCGPGCFYLTFGGGGLALALVGGMLASSLKCIPDVKYQEPPKVEYKTNYLGGGIVQELLNDERYHSW